MDSTITGDKKGRPGFVIPVLANVVKEYTLINPMKFAELSGNQLSDNHTRSFILGEILNCKVNMMSPFWDRCPRRLDRRGTSPL